MSARPLEPVTAGDTNQRDVVSNKTAIEHQAQALIQRAAAVGFNVTISPFGDDFIVNVWERRS
jgi:hypothetical protein